MTFRKKVNLALEARYERKRARALQRRARGQRGNRRISMLAQAESLGKQATWFKKVAGRPAVVAAALVGPALLALRLIAATAITLLVVWILSTH